LLVVGYQRSLAFSLTRHQLQTGQRYFQRRWPFSVTRVSAVMEKQKFRLEILLCLLVHQDLVDLLALGGRRVIRILILGHQRNQLVV